MASEPRAGSLLYIDTSALVKLVVREAESEAVEAELNHWVDGATSTVTRIELPRAVGRRDTGDPTRPEMVFGVLAATNEIPVDDAIVELAVDLGPRELGSLDAIHLASALSLGADLGALMTYDRRLRKAADAAGLPVLAPS